MLYRFSDCGIYDNDSEPNTTVWLTAVSATEAVERAEALLALAWDVPVERVCVQSGKDELSILRDAVEGLPAGDRRLWASGSWGERPTYFPQRVLIAAPADIRLRLLDAFRAAQAHALRLADKVTKEAAMLRGSGHGRQAEHHDFEARTYREFADQA
jgi:hypothetical protein